MASSGNFARPTVLLSSAILFLPLLASALHHHPYHHPHRHVQWPQNLDDITRIIRGVEGGEPLSGLLEPGMQKPEPTPGVRIPEQTPEVPLPDPAAKSAPAAALGEGFYQQSCPQAEKIVSEVINMNFQKDPTLAPALIRLFFHDCFITGCDASILLDQDPTGEPVEKQAAQNGKFVRGFEALDEAKARLEAECPGVVSCADLLAFANRDSLVFTGFPPFPVSVGRRDTRLSLAKNAAAGLPFPESSAEEMIRMFEAKGLTVEDMVVLIGAHSVGTVHCQIVAGRFRDPAKAAGIDRGYLMKMQVMSACLNETQVLAFDPLSEHKMDSRFYKELLKKRSLLESDQNLADEPSANRIMRRYADDQKGWVEKFMATVNKLGEIEVLTGDKGEIRRQCRNFN